MKFSVKIILFILISLLFIVGSAMATDQLTLKKALKLVLDKNSMIKESELDYDKANIDLKMARKGYYPTLSLSSSYTRLGEVSTIPTIVEDLSSPFGFSFKEIESPQDNYSTQLSLQQPVYTGGKIKLGIEQAGLGKEMADIQLKQQKSEVLMNVIRTYYNILLAKDRVDIEKEALELIKKQKKILKASIEVGMALKTDLLQVEIEESKAAQRLEDAKNKLLLAKKNFANMLGIEWETVNLISPDEVPDINMGLDELYKAALKNRPELKMMKVNKKILDNSLKMEQSNKLPNIMLLANYSWQGEELSLEDGSGSITLSGSISLYDAGKSEDGQEKTAKDIEKLLESKDNLEKLIKIELEEKILSIEDNLKNIKIQEMNIDKARKNLELESKRFIAGVGTNIDVLNAQTLLKQTRISKVQAIYQYQINTYELLKKSGRLLDYSKEVIDNEK